jgi:hypothetical protein
MFALFMPNAITTEEMGENRHRKGAFEIAGAGTAENCGGCDSNQELSAVRLAVSRALRG